MSKQLTLSFANMPKTLKVMCFFHLSDLEHCIRLFLVVSYTSREDDKVITGSYGVSALPTDSTDEDEVSTSVLSICTKTKERYEDLPQTYSAYLVQQISLDKCMYYFFQNLSESTVVLSM